MSNNTLNIEFLNHYHEYMVTPGLQYVILCQTSALTTQISTIPNLDRHQDK